MFGLPYTILAPEGLMLDLDRCMLLEQVRVWKLRMAQVFEMAAILDGRQKYDLKRKG